MPRNFWMIVCNEENFRITKNLGFTIQGLKAQYRRKVQRVEAGDRLLYYVSGIRRFTATALVTSSYQEEASPIWKNEGSTGWPYRISIKPEVVLDKPQYIDAGLLAHRLDYNHQSGPPQPRVRSRLRKQRGGNSQGAGLISSSEEDGARASEEHN